MIDHDVAWKVVKVYAGEGAEPEDAAFIEEEQAKLGRGKNQDRLTDDSVRLRVCDDDRVCWYEFQCDSDETAEMLFDHWMAGYGTVVSEIDTGKGWQPFIS